MAIQSKESGFAITGQASQIRNLDVPGGEKARISVTIMNKTPQEVYQFWRNFENLPLFMKDLTSVRASSATKSHWVVKTDHAPEVEWDAEIVREIPGEMIAWKSVEKSDVDQQGAVLFEKSPNGRGTVVRLVMNYSVPGGKLAEFLTKMVGEDPKTIMYVNLRRLKALMETGEIPTTESQPSGRDSDSYPIDTH